MRTFYLVIFVECARDTKGWFVLFTKQFLEYLNENIFTVKNRCFLSEGLANSMELSKNNKIKITTLFMEIFAILGHLSKPNWEVTARSLTSTLLFEIDNVVRGRVEKDDDVGGSEMNNAALFSNLVAKYFIVHRAPAFYASRLGLSTRALYAAIKKELGQTPSALINHRVISEAQHIIARSTKTFSEIAYFLNFSDPFVFSKYFKKHTGLSPKHYRNQLAVNR